jgi:hypothetical protein
MGEMRKGYRILVQENLKGTKPFSRQKPGWQDNINIHLRKTVWTELSSPMIAFVNTATDFGL